MHLHALLLEPRRYSLAAWWRLCGKRVRARGQFAPLLAMSPLAYRFWMASEVRHQIASTVASPQIIALVENRDGADPNRIARTLRSLAAEGIRVFTGVLDKQAGYWLMPITAGDVLAPGAGETYRQAAALPGTCLVYADDDLLNGRAQRYSPHFKPGWNSELFHHLDYLTGACIVRASTNDLDNLTAGACFVTKVALAGEGQIVHIPRVLHHRQFRPAARTLAIAPVDDAALPLVSIIIPTRNGLHLLRTCIEGLARTNYPAMEIIIIDNGSDDPATLAYLDTLDPVRYCVLRHPGVFNFSSLNNRAAAQARGDLLCLLNNDIEITDPNWLRVMAVQALRPDVGAVGAQLLYPDGRIQHAGVVLGICGGAAHAHRLLRPDDEGYHRRHALPQFVSAVTAACLVVQRARFEAVNGLNETDFAIAFNDVDFCMRLNQRGWQSLYEPRARLIHHESVSRGFDRDPAGAERLAGELAALKAAWATDEVVDSFHHPQLNKFSEHFVVRL